MPSWSSEIPISAGEISIPRLSTPRIDPTLSVRFVPGINAPGGANTLRIPVRAFGECGHRLRITDVAHDVDSARARCYELVTKRRNRIGIDVGQHHRHAQRAGMSGEARADACACTGDNGDAAVEGCAHVPAVAELLALCSAKGIESSASSTTLIDVKTRPWSARRIPTSTTPLDTSNGTLLVIWLTYR